MAISIQDFELPYNSYQLYDVSFFNHTIKTLVTHVPCIVDTWILDMEDLHRHRLNKLIVGLDIEWRPNQRSGQNNPAATLQICVGRNCLIIQLIFALEIPQSLKDFLSNQDYTFVGVGIHHDAEKIHTEYGLYVHNMVDLRELAKMEPGQSSLWNAGLVRLASEVLGKNFEKPNSVSRSNWAVDFLTLDQVQYACVDAFVSFEIGRVLKAGN